MEPRPEFFARRNLHYGLAMSVATLALAGALTIDKPRPSYGQSKNQLYVQNYGPVANTASIKAAETTTSSTTAATAPPTTTTTKPAPTVSAAEMTAWSKVNICEESGNWHVHGTIYSGGLGISATNWALYGGQRDFGDEWSATPAEQIIVAERIQPNPPDQNGCTGAW